MKLSLRWTNGQRQVKRILRALLFLTICAPAIAQTGPYHVRIDSIGEFFAQSYSRPVSKPQSSTSRRGARGAEGTVFLVIQRAAVSAKLAEASASGRHFSEAVIERTSSSGGRDEVMTIRLREVVITSFQPYRGSLGGAAAGELEQVGLGFGTMSTTWKSHKSPFAAEPMGRGAASRPSAAPDSGTGTVTDKDDPVKVTMSDIGVFAAQSWNMNSQVAGPNRRRGVADQGNLTLVMKRGAVSAKLAEALASGRHIQKVVIEQAFARHGKEELLRVTLKNVFISRIEAARGNGSAGNLEQVSLTFEEIKKSYIDTGKTVTGPRETRRKQE